MKSHHLFILLFTSLFINLFSQTTKQKSVAVTVYNNNLGVVKDLRSMNIPEGVSTIKLTDVAQRIDPTSVHIKLDGEVLEQNYQYDLVSINKILDKYLDKKIQLVSDKGELLEGTLLASYSTQIVLRKKDGGLLMLPNSSDYKISVEKLPDGLITKPTLVWMVKSNGAGSQDVEVSYQTKGMNWHAEYVAVLNKDDTKLDLNSWVSIENRCGTDFRNAKLKLVAGDVHLVNNQHYNDRYETDMVMAMTKSSSPQFKEKEFFEYHIYNLQRPTTLRNNETKQISLFEASNVKAIKRYYYKGGYYYGHTTKGKVSVIVEFENIKSNNLNIPMPKGKVRVYKSDGKTIEFIGEDLIDHTPRKEKVKLKIGEAFDIVVKDVEKNNRKISANIYEIDYEVTITNRKKEDIIVNVERSMGRNWEMLKSSIKYEKLNSSNILFKVPVKADSKTVLKYRVRYLY
jgi:hypothetical protein